MSDAEAEALHELLGSVAGALCGLLLVLVAGCRGAAEPAGPAASEPEPTCETYATRAACRKLLT